MSRTIRRMSREAGLEDHLELLRCHYKFVRPHMALKFGPEMRTPAIQAGLTTRRLNLREIFSSAIVLSTVERSHLYSFTSASCSLSTDKRLPMA